MERINIFEPELGYDDPDSAGLCAVLPATCISPDPPLR
jgi:hypothetical protein